MHKLVTVIIHKSNFPSLERLIEEGTENFTIDSDWWVCGGRYNGMLIVPKNTKPIYWYMGTDEPSCYQEACPHLIGELNKTVNICKLSNLRFNEMDTILNEGYGTPLNPAEFLTDFNMNNFRFYDVHLPLNYLTPCVLSLNKALDLWAHLFALPKRERENIYILVYDMHY